MRGHWIWVLVVAAGLVWPATAQAQGDPDNPVEFVRNLPLEAESAIGARKIGDLLYLTGTRALSIYRLTDPLDPELVSHTPLGYQWQNEDVSTNGRILLISESLPADILHVWDVSDPARPLEVGRALFAGNHTSECLHDCTWSYGSEGDIIDLRDPANPVLAGDWIEKIGLADGAHDLEEVRPGLVVVATLETPFLALDVTDPVNPRVIGSGEHPDPDSYIFHQVVWPNRGDDRLVLAAGEINEGPFMTYAVGGTPQAPTFTQVDSYTLGTTSHWFDPHPRFRDGGLVAAAWYGNGTRFLKVASDGRITEVGHFNASERGLTGGLPDTTWAAVWVTDDVVYAIDNARGVDILKWLGPIPEVPATTPLPAVAPAPSPAGPAVCAPPAPAAIATRGGVRFPGASLVDVRVHARGARLVGGRRVARVRDRLRAARLPRGIYEARVRVGGRLRRVALERRGRRLRVGPALGTAAPCGPLASAALNAPAFGGAAGKALRLRYRLSAAAPAVTVEVAAGGRVVRTLAGATSAGLHTVAVPARLARRGARVEVRVLVAGAGTIVLGARRV